jgi:arylformamidase
MKYIDLSHQLTDKTLTYPSDPNIIISKEKKIKTDGSLLNSIKMGTHTGTHLDVPAHIIEKGKTLGDFPLSSFTGKSVKVDKNTFSSLKNLDLKINGIFYETGWAKYFNKSKFYDSNKPIIPNKLIDTILDSNVNFFGCDLPSVDVSGQKNKPIHNKLLKSNIIIYESLANLDKIPLLKVFDFYGFPLPFIDLDGSPVRAICAI